MLKRLSIKNYALIKQLDISFEDGYSVITGETGAGKSIILGALGLILGNRLDSINFKNQAEKCIIEGHFVAEFDTVKPFFEKFDFDFEEETILRREINLSGKSRMFLNDTPISLEQLKQFKNFVINIHSQHETLTISEHQFQFQFVDAIAENQLLLNKFRKTYKAYKNISDQLNQLVEKQKSYEKEKSFVDFQLNEIEELNLQKGEEKELLQELSILANAESLTEKLNSVDQLLDEEDFGILERLQQLCVNLTKLEQIDDELGPLSDRSNVLLEELQDIHRELSRYSEKVEMNPERLEFVEARLSKIHALNLKHQVKETDGLLLVRDKLKNNHLEFIDNEVLISELKQKQTQTFQELDELSDKLHKARDHKIEQICLSVIDRLKLLGIPDALFEIKMSKVDEFNSFGKNKLEFLFSANRGRVAQSISKVASGGELSRLMLAIKALMAQYTSMPTMIFDEIDSGISGEIANKMATLLEEMSTNMQIIAITHSPQLASKGRLHYHVLKQNEENEIITSIKRLNDDERVVEIAKMLSGSAISDAAISNAKDLIKNN